MKKPLKYPKQGPKKRISPILNITLPPLTKQLGKMQAKLKGITYSRHVAELIEAESNRPIYK